MPRWALIVVLAGSLAGCPKPAADPAVERGVQYFVARQGKADPIALMFLDYLRRKHALTSLTPVVAQLKNVKPDPTHPDPELMFHLRTYVRLYDPSVDVAHSELALAANQMDRLALEAMYCDREGSKEDLGDRLRALATNGGYYITHAALYTGWALENGRRVAGPRSLSSCRGPRRGARGRRRCRRAP